jgi:hypothetical protein
VGGVKRCKLIRKELNLSRARHGDLGGHLDWQDRHLDPAISRPLSPRAWSRSLRERLKRGKSRGGDIKDIRGDDRICDEEWRMKNNTPK